MTGQQPAGQTFGERLRWAWDEGLRRHVIVENTERRVLDLPLTVMLVAMVLAPWLVVLGGVVAVLLSYSMRVERRANDPLAGPDPAHAWDPAPEDTPQPAPESTTGPGTDRE